MCLGLRIHLNPSSFVLCELSAMLMKRLWVWGWGWGGGMSLQCKNVKAHTLYVLFPFSISVYLFLSPRLTSSLCLSPPLCSSGYSLLHVTREDTWKRIQLQVWHLVARMPALRGKLWQRVRTLSPRSQLWEWHENTSAQTHTQTN